MQFRNLKLELFYIRKAFLQYHHGFKYLWNKHVIAGSILKEERVLERTQRNDDLSIHVLTRKRDMVMLCWALASFYRVWSEGGQLYIHSDGSIGQHERSMLKRLFPQAYVVEPRDVERDAVVHKLDAARRAAELRMHHPEYFLLKKLLDPFLISDTRYRLVIDSDVLWFRHPAEIVHELENGCESSFMMTNNRPSYVFFKEGRMGEEKALLNSGIVLYRQDHFDFPMLEDYFGRLDLKDLRNAHFIEQAGYAHCLKNITALPSDRYPIQGPVTAVTIAKHYTSVRRPLLYVEGLPMLRKVLNPKF